MQEMMKSLRELFPQLVDMRRDFHMYPELSFEEVRTPRKIAAYLQSIGVEVKTHVGKAGGGNGIVGKIVGAKPGDTIALRADFDGLPIQDMKDVPYRSKVEGVMHACGHDIHTVSLLGVATVLMQVQEHIQGTIVLIHQFAEEKGEGGAKPMIADGCLDGVDYVYGAHVWAPMPYGTIGVRRGAAMASYDGFEIDVIGSGGHGAEPHHTIDPIVTASSLVMNLQQIASRRVNPIDPVVLSIGAFQSGEAGGVIPGKASITGTVRTFNNEVRNQVEEDIRTIVDATCSVSGATSDITYIHGYPPLHNDESAAQNVFRVAEELFGDQSVQEMAPMMSAEDFSYYVREKPGAFFFVGGGNEAIGATFPHHHEMFDVDERSILHIGMMFLGILKSHDVLPFDGQIEPFHMESTQEPVK